MLLRTRERRLLRRLLIDNGILSVLAVVVMITTTALSSGCGSGTNFSKQSPSETTMSARNTKIATIRVTGTPGTSFEGSYGSRSAGMERVEGEVPQDYEVYYNSLPGAFDGVTAKMQKQAEDYGKLTVQIIVDGQTKKERSTAAGFGVAQVSWHTSEP
jgi:hypothetical protein